MINEKMKKVGKEGSAIVELSDYGKKRKKEIGENNVFDFSIGNPSVPCPDSVTKNLIDIIKNTDPVKLHSYTSMNGVYETRHAIAEYLNKTYGSSLSGEYIYMTPGASSGLTICFHALLNKDDEVIVFAPFFPEYKVFIEKAYGKVVALNCDKNTCLPDLKLLKKSITKRTKMVIINSPNNPTGVIYKEDLIKQISSILNQKQKEYDQDIYLLSDEPYRELIYSDVKYPFITNYYSNSIVVYSFSKSLSLPGERIGYILLGDKLHKKEDVYNAIKGAGRSLGYESAPALFQYLIPSCLGVTSNISIYKENRDILYNYLIELGYQVIYPEGAFYSFMKCLEEDSIKFSNVAKKFELLLVPSNTFGINGFVRISYCVSKEMIIKSLPSFKKLKQYYAIKKRSNYGFKANKIKN